MEEKELHPDKEVHNTYGYLTKNKESALAKEHHNDAYVWKFRNKTHS